MKRETIFPEGIRNRHKEGTLLVNVYPSHKNKHGIQYGYARSHLTGFTGRNALYRIRIKWK